MKTSMNIKKGIKQSGILFLGRKSTTKNFKILSEMTKRKRMIIRIIDFSTQRTKYIIVTKII